MSRSDNTPLFYVYVCPDATQRHLAGILTYHESAAISTFQYVRSYREREDLPPIAPMPTWRKNGPPIFTQTMNRGLPGPIRDALPDYWGTLVYAKKLGVSVESVQFSDLLQADVQDRPGFLAFSRDLESGPVIPAPVNRTDDVLDLATIVQAVESLEQEGPSSYPLQPLADFLVQRTSMGGARPKLSVYHQGQMWLAKLPAYRDSYDVALLEQASMILARRAGITTPNTQLYPLQDGRHVFLSQRFDRIGTPENRRHLAMVSGLSLLNFDEGENRLGSYPALASHLRMFGDLSGSTELFRRMIFNWLIRNTDDHLRNHAVILGVDGTWQLSPAYDINPTHSRPGLHTQFDLSIALGKEGRQATLQNALSMVEAFGLDPSRATHIVNACCEALQGWREVLQDLGLSQKEIDFWEHSFSDQSKKVLSPCS
ncbi:type II toxin-antitoxin system HipA family toxin [Acidithiobacillus sulfurivorans]|uniref:HipA domain-containing protein n=1 Tax=Acidithiobacillus sulfurivorans TaxID=1958756 RepID=A0ABS6A131_9PROT|nr:HipA domain-containing protein [Acidithiobacillus sulfurivorans]MBU2761213.1 HipA domain-containing protein [Acidithiobacillus sulfurivorans]